MIFLDTHVVVWLYWGNQENFSPVAQHRLQYGELVISPMVVLELQYLYESKKITASSRDIISELQQTIGLRVLHDDWYSVTAVSIDLDWTRDPFDRFIVAHAIFRKAELLSKDAHLKEHYAGTAW